LRRFDEAFAGVSFETDYAGPSATAAMRSWKSKYTDALADFDQALAIKPDFAGR
jgi:hypothetical protein